MGHPRTAPRLPLLVALLSVPLVLLAFGTRVSADMGPKPSLVVRVVNGPAADAYRLDLLAVPISYANVQSPGSTVGETWEETLTLRLKAYRDGTDRVALVSNQCLVFGKLVGTPGPNGTVIHSFGYIGVPHAFAVIVEDAVTGEMTVSNAVATAQFDALVEYDAATNTLTALQNTTSTWWWLKLLFRILLTVVVECLLVLPFRFPMRRWLPIPVNLGTQFLLNVVMLLALPGLFQAHYALAFGVLEGVVWLLEFGTYYFFMAERRFWKPFLYAVLANGVTLALGLWWLS